MQTAVGAGFFPIGVTYGFRERAELEENGAELIVDDAPAIADAILGSA